MRNYKFIGLFKSAKGHQYELTVNASSAFESFFLLTAKAIQEGKHYQLHTITDVEKGNIFYVDDIMKISSLINQAVK